MFYLFSPLLDEEGKQVVRNPNAGEWIGFEGRPFLALGMEVDDWPILTLQKFDNFRDLTKFVIAEYLERLEGKK